MSTIEDWSTARHLFQVQYTQLADLTKYGHFWEYYFPPIPRWGNVAHRPGEVHSCQGLEKSWDMDKQAIKFERLVCSKSISSLCNIFSGISNR